MHRTLCHARTLAGAALLALLFGVPGVGLAQPAGTSGSSLIVPINGTVKLQMTSKKPISKVESAKDGVISIRTVVGDPTTVLITGQQPDVSELTMTDVDGKQERYHVIVQLDVEYLRTQLRRAVPTANVTPIPVSNNSVIMAGTADKAEDVDVVLRVAQSLGVQVINAMKVGGVQQVQIDVVVASVTRSEDRSFGFDFLANSRNFFLGSTVSQAVTQPASVGLATAGAAGGFGNAPNLGGIPAANSNLLFGVIHNGWGFLGFLNALRQEGLAKLIVQPRLCAVSGRTASFLIGGEQAIPVPAGLGQIGVQFEEFGTRLNVLPIVLGNGKIHLEIEPEISSLDAANGTSIQGTVVPGRDTQRVNTTVELETGQTFVIGGLIQHTVATNTRKVPVLGDLPFLGTFFSEKIDNQVEQEVIILVTPYLVDGQSCDQVAKVLPGQETRSPDDFELFLEGILEAPHGPRQVCEDWHYIPAFKHSSTTGLFPNAGKTACCGTGLTETAGGPSVDPSHLLAPGTAAANGSGVATSQPAGPVAQPAPNSNGAPSAPESAADKPAQSTPSGMLPPTAPPGPSEKP